MAEIGIDYFDPVAGQPVTVTPAKPLPVATNAPTSALESAPPAGIPETTTAAVAPTGAINRLITDGAGRLNNTNEDLLRQLIREVRVTNRLLLIGLNVDADIDASTDMDYD